MLKFGSELRYGNRSPNVRTPVDIPTRNQSKFTVQNPVRSNTHPVNNGDKTVHQQAAQPTRLVHTFIYTTHIVQKYVRVIIVWLWALILALGIGEGMR